MFLKSDRTDCPKCTADDTQGNGSKYLLEGRRENSGTRDGYVIRTVNTAMGYFQKSSAAIDLL